MGTTRMAYKWLGDQSGDQSPVSKLNDADEHEKFNSVTFFALKGQWNTARGFNLWTPEPRIFRPERAVECPTPGVLRAPSPLQGEKRGISPVPEVQTSGCNPAPFQGKERDRIIFLTFISVLAKSKAGFSLLEL